MLIDEDDSRAGGRSRAGAPITVQQGRPILSALRGEENILLFQAIFFIMPDKSNF